MVTLRGSLFAIAILLASGSATANTTTNDQQRQRFLEARAALDKGDGAQFVKLTSQLRDYPLYPYLLFWQMERMETLDGRQVHAFLNRYGDAPIATPLRERWLRQLAGKEQWDEYITDYRPGKPGDLRCNYHYAQLQGGNQTDAWAGARELWLTPTKQDNACNRLFDAWQQSGGLTTDLRRQRLDMALHVGNIELANQIAAPLPDKDRNRITLWQQAYSRPVTLLDKPAQKDNNEQRDLAIYVVQRFARTDPHGAADLWRQLGSRYAFSETERNMVLNVLVLRLALEGDASALEWFSQITPAGQQTETRQWAIRAALRHQLWKDALKILNGMPENERHDEEWQYWTARSLEALGETASAQPVYLGIANNSSYYGFLAADRLNLGYNLSHTPLNVDEKTLNDISQVPALIRAHELLQVNLGKEARREWDYAITNMNPSQRLAAGKLASHWNWPDRAALTLAKAEYYEDLEIRFPLAFTDAVMKEAQVNTLDPAWIFAVARQESVMNPEARSPVGALGLMQLMPATGRKIAQKLKSAISDLQQLLIPETNIRFGTYYLRELSDQFGDHKALATAAYNAGPQRVVKWAPPQTTMDADIWIDNIPFNETRTYVRRVLAYSVFYDQRLAKNIVRLRDRLPVVKQ